MENKNGEVLPTLHRHDCKIKETLILPIGKGIISEKFFHNNHIYIITFP